MGAGTIVLRRSVSPAPSPVRSKVLIVTTPSDVHSWNLVYLSLVARDAGMDSLVVGPATSYPEVSEAVESYGPDLVLVSSINGHGEFEAPGVLQAVRAVKANRVPVIIGGTLGVSPSGAPRRQAALTAAGFWGVFEGIDMTEQVIVAAMETAIGAQLNRSALSR